MELNTVHFIAPWYNYYPILCDSLRLQTVSNWTLDLYHDGPHILSYCGEWMNDKRVNIRETKIRYNDYGHSVRKEALMSVKTNPDYIVVTNADNYYCPVFIEQMLKFIDEHTGAYCDVVHSHVFPPCQHGYELLSTQMMCGKIDCGCVLVKAELAIKVGWNNTHWEADWSWIENMTKIDNDFIHVPIPMFVHN